MSRSVCRRNNVALVCVFCALTVLLFLDVMSRVDFLQTSLTTFSQSVGQTSAGHIFLNSAAPHLLPGTTSCFVVKNSRYLLNANGFQIGHWGSVLTNILGALDAKVSSPHASLLQRVYVLFIDSKASGKKLRSVEASAARSEYMTSTLGVLKVLTGLDFELLRSGAEKNRFMTTTCFQENTVFVDAGSFPTDDGWIGRFASSVPNVLSEHFKCNQSATDDVLIYNRRGTRRIVNEVEVARALQEKGLTTKILTPNELSPVEQICEVTKNRKMIITPHGGHQGTLLFKRQGVAVVVVSPKSALLDCCYRFFAKRSDPWYSIRGERAWSCPDVCSSSEDAFFDPSCDDMCIRRARREDIGVSLGALERIVAKHFRSEERAITGISG
jgi:hypothetical protein